MLAPLTSQLDFDGAALQLRAQRAQLLASNLANADTPGFKARDIDFAQALHNATGVAVAASGATGTGGTTGGTSPAAVRAVPLARTDPAHLDGTAGTGGTAAGTGDTLYRVPMQAALDGNSVEPDVERAAFLENSLRYQAGLKFMTGQIKQMLSAISGT
jgi:flagellar basal-body rod protein FlgB